VVPLQTELSVHSALCSSVAAGTDRGAPGGPPVRGVARRGLGVGAWSSSPPRPRTAGGSDDGHQPEHDHRAGHEVLAPGTKHDHTKPPCADGRRGRSRASAGKDYLAAIAVVLVGVLIIAKSTSGPVFVYRKYVCFIFY